MLSRFSLSVVVIGILCALPAGAWVYPEHRDIAVQAVVRLSPRHRAVLDSLWTAARVGHEGRLSATVVEPLQGREPDRIDWAAWSAIGGDHSCSPVQLVETVLHADWILDVADVAARLKQDLEEADGAYARANAMRNADLRMQRHDPDYATRAGSNNVHFLQARRSLSVSLSGYLHDCLIPGAELNAVGAYVYYHEAALRKAVQYRRTTDQGQRRQLALAMLAEEAFALHFLEDMFASGHVAGTWGETAERKGTHDYYCEHGMEATSWSGTTTILMGDAYMTSRDAEHAAVTIRRSLEQLLDVVREPSPYDTELLQRPPVPTFDVCAGIVMPAVEGIDSTAAAMVVPIMADVAIPGLADGAGALPRFRAEFGPFIGVNAGVCFAGVSNGFGPEQSQVGAITGLSMNVRLGLGLDGVLNAAGDGLIFVEAGYRLDGSSSMSLIDSDGGNMGGAVTAAIPSRSAYQVRLRMPFYVLPGDLIAALPLYLIAPDAYKDMAVSAGNGGLIPWQSAIATPVGRFQFVLGRELGFTFYGYGAMSDRLLMPVDVDGGQQLTVVGVRSLAVDIPFLEYKPFRSFSQTQSSGVLLQFFVGVDIPIRSDYVLPGFGPQGPALQTISLVGLRCMFEWRHYW